MTSLLDHNDATLELSSEETVVRSDHVMMSRTGLSSILPCAGSYRGRWLVLTSKGAIRLYKGKRPNYSGTFELLATSPDQLQARRGRLLRRNSLRIQLGAKRRRIQFDGRETAPSFVWYLVKAIPHVGEIVHGVYEVFEWFSERKPRREARDAWLPVLVPARDGIDPAEAAMLAPAS
jgi:hypothetical protein